MIRPDVTRRARIVLAVGMTGSGKSHFLKSCLRQDRPERLLIFDLDGEYREFGAPVDSIRDLVRAVQLPRFAVAFQPAPFPGRLEEEFELCARLAFELCRAGRSITFAADELQEVTRNNRAWPWWAALVRRGRKFGATVYAGAQRMAEIDKTIVSNATFVRSGYLGFPEDQRTIAQALGVSADEVARLSGHAFIARDKFTGELQRSDRVSDRSIDRKSIAAAPPR